MRSKTFFTVVLILLFCAQARAQKGQYFFSPNVSVGFTFHAKLNFGFGVDLGKVAELSSGMKVRYGLSFNQYYVFTKQYMHRLRSVNVMGQTDFLDLKIGFGRARNKWGRNEKNRCIVHGINYDISVAAPSIYSPWIGFRRFNYPAANWAWFLYPYNSVYVKYKYDLIQNTGLKDQLSL